jgi:hypothetical protein
MKKLLAGVVALQLLTGVTMAGQPTPLSDEQMDTVTAGLNVGTTAAMPEMAFMDNDLTLTLPPMCAPNCLVSAFPSLDGVPEPAYPSVMQFMNLTAP